MKTKKIFAIMIIIICLILMGFNTRVYGLSDGDYAFYSEGSVFYYTKLLSSTINPIIAVIPNGSNMICVKMYYDSYSGYFCLPSGYEQYYNAPYNISKQLIASDLTKKWSKDSGSNYYYINTAMGNSSIATYKSGEVPNQYNYSTQSSNTNTGTNTASTPSNDLIELRTYEDSEYTYKASIRNGNITDVIASSKTRNSRGQTDTYMFSKERRESNIYWINGTIDKMFSETAIKNWGLETTNESTINSTINSKVYDTSDSSESGTGYTSGVNPDNYKVTPDIEEGEVTNLVGKILGFINVIGIIIFILSIMILGIKYMVGSVEQKADYKHTMIPMLIGAFLIFGITSVLNLVYSLVSQID